MDARKALFRAKLQEQKQEKRIESPLVRYNEYDQPVCRVCNVTLKSESLWIAHQASRKHHEAIQNLKATAARASANTSEATKDSRKPGYSVSREESFLQRSSKMQENVGSANQPTDVTVESSSASVPNNQIKRSLPEDFFDEGASNKQVKRTLPEGFFDETPTGNKPLQGHTRLDSEVKKVKGILPESKEVDQIKPSNVITRLSENFNTSENLLVKGTLPEGFFDNKNADLRARGIEPIKIDINDAYKEFEKEIQEDLQEVDDRLEEEEIDAAEVREEYESLEQKEYRERVEMVKKRLLEVRAARLEKGRQGPAIMGQESSDESSSSDTDEEENFTIDWRAKHV